MAQENKYQRDMDSIVSTAVREIESMRDSARPLPLVLYAENRLQEMERMAKQLGTKIPEKVVKYVRRISMEYQLRVSLKFAEKTKENPEECQRWVEKARTYAKGLGITLREIDPLLDIAYQKN